MNQSEHHAAPKFTPRSSSEVGGSYGGTHAHGKSRSPTPTPRGGGGGRTTYDILREEMREQGVSQNAYSSMRGQALGGCSPKKKQSPVLMQNWYRRKKKPCLKQVVVLLTDHDRCK